MGITQSLGLMTMRNLKSYPVSHIGHFDIVESEEHHLLNIIEPLFYMVREEKI